MYTGYAHSLNDVRYAGRSLGVPDGRCFNSVIYQLNIFNNSIIIKTEVSNRFIYSISEFSNKIANRMLQ